MNILRKATIGLIVVGLVALFVLIVWWQTGNKAGLRENISIESPEGVVKGGILPISEEAPATLGPVIKHVGPRENIPEDAPIAYGFWSFAMPVTGVLSRSGQPLIAEFEWLAEQGWHGVVNLRVDGERDEVGDDAKLPGFNELGLNYLHLPLVDGHPPTDEQAEQFLAFVIDKANQPVHVHCRGGIGRAGTMTVLYRYAVQGWPMEEAIEESRPFKGGISQLQQAWLEEWAQDHRPGSYADLI